MKVLSLFDGMSCGMIAFVNAKIPVERYVAYEIDKYAIQSSVHNFPMIEQCGDVFAGNFKQYEGFDFLIGGSPCTYWSIAQKNNRETEASGMGWELFSQYVRALKEAKPKYFIYENNKSMSKAIRQSITETFGFEPICINSALVSAQNRQRLYWIGIRQPDGTYRKADIEQPADRGILLKDILQTGCDLTCNDKSYTVTASYDGAVAWNTIERCQRNMVAEPVRIPPYGSDEKSRPVGATYPNHAGTGEGSLKQRMFSPNPNKEQVDLIAEPINTTSDGNARTIKAGYYKRGMAHFITNGSHNSTAVAEPIRVGTYPQLNGELSESKQFRIYDINGKSTTLCGNGGGLGAKTGLYTIPVDDMPPFVEKKLTDVSNKHGEIPPMFNPYNNPAVTDKAPTQTAQCGSWTNSSTVCLTENIKTFAIPAMPVSEATAAGYTEIECGDCVDLSMPNSKTRRGRNMAEKSNCMQTSNEFYQYVGYAIEFGADGKPTKAIGKDGKEITIYEVRDGKITIKGKQYPIKLRDGFYIIRKLTVLECMRLQTVPEWYQFPVSDTQAYKQLGNGWTVDVIVHILKGLIR